MGRTKTQAARRFDASDSFSFGPDAHGHARTIATQAASSSYYKPPARSFSTFVTSPHKSSFQPHPTTSRNLPGTMTETQSTIRTFGVFTPDGLQISLTTAVPGELFIQYQSRSHSEPALSSAGPSRATREPQSEYIIPITIDKPLPAFLTNDHPSMSRQYSFAPTEPEDDQPTPEALSERRVKVHDYAFTPPATRRVVGASEIFDQNKGIAEYDYFLANRRISDGPLPARLARRLLDMGWITLEEAHELWLPMDWQALREYDAKAPHYPWKPMRSSPESPVMGAPTREYRIEIKKNNAEWLAKYNRRVEAAAEGAEKDRLYIEWEKEAQKAWADHVIAMDEDERELTVEEEREARELEEREQRWEDLDAPKVLEKESVPSDRSSGKRGRRSDDVEDEPQAKRRRTPTPPPTSQQFPAPLSSYNPDLYPHDQIIASQSQSQSQSPSGTPPSLEPPSLSSPGGSPSGKPKRGISRTRTFAQLM